MTTKPTTQVWDHHGGRIDYIFTNAWNALAKQGMDKTAQVMYERLISQEFLVTSYVLTGRVPKRDVQRWVQAIAIIGEYVELDWTQQKAN